MSLTKNDIYIIAVLALVALAIYKFDPKSEVHNHYATVVDTVQKIRPLEVKPTIEPAQKQVQREPDRQLRKKAERETIITGINYDKKSNQVDIQKVDTAGTVTDEKYNLDPESGFKADNKGVEEKKKTKAGKFLQKAGKGIKTGLATIGVITLIILATK